MSIQTNMLYALISKVAKYGQYAARLMNDDNKDNPRKKKSYASKLKDKKRAKQSSVSRKRNRK